MSSADKGNAGDQEAACTSNKQASLPTDKKPNTKATGNSGFERALAQRALFRSHTHKVKGRKVANNIARTLPSRLSKVSLADDSADE
ncbi:unnamed protein product [Linum trigynum]|uniref:Uncharacterized protein n=1 Tax=Linum trigynum TaxID=586398 RepID=A0AAV2FH87_9ROSI